MCYQDAERSENEKGVGYDYVYLLMLLVVEGWMIDYADGCAMLSLRGYEQEQAHDKSVEMHILHYKKRSYGVTLLRVD